MALENLSMMVRMVVLWLDMSKKCYMCPRSMGHGEWL